MMTIHNFDWGLFWETRHYVSWYEVGALALMTLAWIASILATIENAGRGKSVGFSLLTSLGYLSTAAYKLFVQLDACVIFYIALTFLCLFDLIVGKRAASREAAAIRREQLLARSSHGHGSHSHGREHTHSHGRREHSHSRRHGESPDEKVSTGSAERAKDPKFGDELKLD